MSVAASLAAALRRGDDIIGQSGILGKVSKVNDDGTLEVEIGQGVKVKMIKSAVAQVVSKTEPAAN